MESALTTIFLISLVLTILLQYLEVSDLRTRWRHGFVTKAKLLDRETEVTEGLLCDLGHQYLPSFDGESPDVERFLIYEFSLREDGEERTYEGRQRVTEEVTLEPGFPMRIGRPVRVRYRLDEPCISRVEDDALAM